MDYSAIELSVKDHVAHLVLNRPERANVINAETSRELLAAAIECDENPDIRAVLIRANGPMFCGGGDLKTFVKHGDELPAYLKETTTYLHGAVSRLTRQSAPVVCAVHGFAAGGGFSLAISGDLVLASQSAKFTMAYTKAGLTPDGSSTYFLPRLVGLRRALDLALTNRVLSADEAVEWGLASQVVSDDDLVSEAEALAVSLAQGATWALGTAKSLLHGGFGESLETQMEMETRAIADSVRTHDGREGIRAFVEKRRPAFTGT
ncbi:MAG: enoyl-CoA hydratase-related protein [Bryobacterales bacterium]|nr:enoyl-CoA hydratase-related protein [Bryobacterales bacterium]